MTSKNLLIVDDNQWWAESLERIVRPHGFEVSYAPHGLAAIDSVDQSKPDVILLDLFLPGPNGLALIHELKSHDDLAAIPIVVVSSAVNSQAASVLQKYGINQSLDKATTTPAEILGALRKAIL